MTLPNTTLPAEKAPMRTPTFADIMEEECRKVAHLISSLFLSNKNFATGFYFREHPQAASYVKRVFTDQVDWVLEQTDEIDARYRDFSDTLYAEAASLCNGRHHALDSGRHQTISQRSIEQIERLRQRIRSDVADSALSALQAGTLPTRTESFVSQTLPGIIAPVLDEVRRLTRQLRDDLQRQLDTLEWLEATQSLSLPALICPYDGDLGSRHQFVAHDADAWSLYDDSERNRIADILNARFNCLAALAFGAMSRGQPPSDAVTAFRAGFKHTLDAYAPYGTTHNEALQCARASLVSTFGDAAVLNSLAQMRRPRLAERISLVS